MIGGLKQEKWIANLGDFWDLLAVNKPDREAADPLRRFTVADAVDMYNIDRWGKDFISVSDKGHLLVEPRGLGNGSIDLRDLIDQINRRGIESPVLVRFSDMLKARIATLNGAFARAIGEYKYEGDYRGVYPIKVNQNRKVVEEIVEFGKPYHYGLEVGSKPELIAAIAMHEDAEALIVCNGYKDADYIELALYASHLGKKVIIVIEKMSELSQILSVAKEVGIVPRLGIRARLSSRGAGRWEQSGGDKAKFGLSAGEILLACQRLKEADSLDKLVLLHFHLGSQISAIRSIKTALREAGRFYVELHKLGCSALEYFDVGGGLGVDYDGSQTNFASSMNYTVQEYANDVVYSLQQTCDENAAPHPTIVTEAGRAIVAHHSVLLVNVLGVSEFGYDRVPGSIPENSDPIVSKLMETCQGLTSKNVRESYHDALEYKDQTLQLFNLGHLSLEDRVLCERIFWAVARRIETIMRTMSPVPEELTKLEKALSDTYFCNFSVFQSLPDAWAIEQLFPIVPIHRLNERPTRFGILADITCDSDGKIDNFIGTREIQKVLPLHRHPTGSEEPYYLAFFLVGAYQEILGDMHNLFGDTNAVHVHLGPQNQCHIEEVVSGDTVDEVLRYVEFEPAELLRKLRGLVEKSLRQGIITLEDSKRIVKRYRESLSSYTYLES